MCLWTLILFCLQCICLFVFLLLFFFWYFSWKIDVKNPDQRPATALLRRLFKTCSYIWTYKISQWFFVWNFLSTAKALDFVLCSWIYQLVRFVQAKALHPVISLFTVAIFLIFYGRKSQVYFVVGKKRSHWFATFIIFLPVSTFRSILAIRTARIIIRRWKPPPYFQDIY